MPDRKCVRSERRAENPGIRKEDDELRLDSWIQIRLTKERVAVHCSLLGDG